MRGLAEQAPRCRSPALMDPHSNPFAVLSLIVAPAILTNAASVLAMSTSNRLARAVDRARELARQLEDTSHPDPSPDEESRESARRLHELSATEDRAVLLMRVLQSFYISLGGFAVAVLSSLLGAVISLFLHGLFRGHPGSDCGLGRGRRGRRARSRVGVAGPRDQHRRAGDARAGREREGALDPAGQVVIRGGQTQV